MSDLRAPAPEQEREMEAGPKMNALVAEGIMGWRWLRWMGDASRLMAHGDVGRFLSRGNIAGVEGVDYEAADVSEPLHKYATYLVPSYSTDIAAAWTVVEAMRARGCVVVIVVQDKYVVARVEREHGEKIETLARGYGESAPLAICRATLSALRTGGTSDA